MSHVTDTQMLTAINNAVNGPVAKLLTNREVMVNTIKRSPAALASWESADVAALDAKWESKIHTGHWTASDVRSQIEAVVKAFLLDYLANNKICFVTNENAVVILSSHSVDDKVHHRISSIMPQCTKTEPVIEYHHTITWGYLQAMYKRCLGPLRATHSRSPYGQRTLAALQSIRH